jgi:hypothetical protein
MHDAARRLACDQDYAADAHVNAYALTDLAPVLEDFGNRGASLRDRIGRRLRPVRFLGSAGHVVSIVVVDQAGGFSSPGCGLELIRPLGTTVASVVHAFRCEIRATLHASGLFTVRVIENGNNATMTYSLQLERLSPIPPSAPPLDAGVTVTGARIDPIGDHDLYVFQGTNSDAVASG